MKIRAIDSAFWVRRERGDTEAYLSPDGVWITAASESEPVEVFLRPEFVRDGLSDDTLRLFAGYLMLDPDWFLAEWERQVGPLART